ncbi:MAG: hypothetical protein BGP13_09025 [Sphingobacteriales bacterium 40-81]|nr:MAG: hypothetical protein BGP13_09025 [Sphingobacteriales bacterium 40-81]
MHPMIVHFPISLLFIALFMELLGRKSGKFNAAIKMLVYTGAASAVLSVILGLLLAGTEEYGSDVFSIHKWTGIATMVLGLLSAAAYAFSNRTVQRTLLTFTALGVTIAGHYGASLTHGEDYLTSVLPRKDAPGEEQTTAANFTLTAQAGPLNETQIQELNLQVRTILAHNCYNCHGSAKVKGELRLDSKEAIFKGGEHGKVIVPGDVHTSELLRRIKLPRSDKEAMPTKGKALSKEEIAVIEYWIKQGAPWPSGELKSLYRVAELAPRLPKIPAATGDLSNPVDLFVNDYFKKNKIKWAAPVDDRTYIRRVYIDVTGLLPPPDSIDAFLKDTSPGKRSVLVSRLLTRDDDYAQHWLTFWNDALRNDYTGTGYITGGRWDITKWLYTSLRENKPYNEFVRQLVSPDKESQGFVKGIKWRGTINSSQSTEMQAAQNVAQVFLGLNLKCASCHDSFISDWKLEDSYAFANLFSDSILEINRCDKPTGIMAPRRVLYKELGEIDTNAVTQERLKQLAELLVQPKDGRLYRTLVNRVWAQLMGRGIVEPVDVMDNAPWSQDLLDWLAYDFVENGYDIKKLIYNILTSKTYQLPSVGVKEPEEIMSPNFVFNGMLRRRLTAEEFSDAVSVAIQPVYADSMAVFKLLPEDFNRNVPFARASLVKNDPFLTALGRPNRETVSTSRTSQASLLQALELTNGSKFNDAMKYGAAKWKNKYPDTKTLVKEIYRNAIGRLPDKAEEEVAEKALGNTPSEAAIQDFMWAIALHPEFQLIY